MHACPGRQVAPFVLRDQRRRETVIRQTCRECSWYEARVAATKASGESLVTTGCATGTGAMPEGAPVIVIRFTGEAARKFRPSGAVDE
jgi:hypothetical protein